MRVALIGLGMVADTHVAAIRDASPQLTLHGVLGRTQDSTQAYAQKHATRGYASLDDLAGDSDVDFVILATPPDARLPVVQTLAAAGKPILMEKPIERDLATATQIVALCEQAKIPLGVVFQHRVRQASVALKEAIEAGDLGTIATVDLRVPWWRDQRYYDAPRRGTYARDGGGVMISQAIHTLDLAMWLLGPITSVQAMMRKTPLHSMEAEDWAGALFEMQNGAIGTMMATTAAYPGGAETITVQGTRASAHLGSGVLTLSRLDGTTEVFGATTSTGGGADPMAFTHAWHQSVIEDFARAIANSTPSPIPAAEALRTHAVIDAMQTASRTAHREKVHL
ncbi:Gfo/Idh/MocA family oxidoreductase [Sulfitobacter sp. HNIBRBA2951]|uniref:Gfo/Idh/MocA family protein n=1 Tax=Sulfitobacter aquimarinus TaxID=3158557 RepID=UPI0032DE84B4